MAYPDDVLLGLTKDITGCGGAGTVSIETLAKLASYHTVRRIKVGSDSFGLVDYPKKQAASRLTDLLARSSMRTTALQEKHPGIELRMRGSIYLIPPKHNETSWDLWIHRIFVQVGDTDSYYSVSA